MAKTENKVSNWTATLQECSPIFVDQVERIARKLGFSTDFEFEDLSSEQREHFLNQLLKTKCAFFVRDEELELKGFLLPAVTENLFNADLKVLDLTGLLSFCKRSSQGNYLHFKHVIIEVISSVCQNLEELFLFDMFSMNHSRHLKMVMEPELMGSLERFPHLRMIQMESFTFEINPLLKLCAALPTLDYLQINLHIERNQLPTATYLRECLSNLKVFLFYTFYRKWDRLAFRRLCTENLPQLQILWRFVGDFTTNFNIIDTTSPRTSNMRHLNVINGFELTCDMHEKFPFVTHLAIDWAECKTAYEHDKNALKNFPNLTSLEIFYFPPDVCFEILEHYKESLIELETAGAENLNFKQILTCCQKLEKISFQSYDFSVWQQLDSFANLKEIKLDLSDTIFTNILSAPDLKNVTIFENGYYVVGESDLENLTYLIAKRKILQKLETLVIHLKWHSIEDVRVSNFKNIAELIKFAAFFLPKLSVIKLTLNKYCSYLLLMNCLKDVKVTIEDIKSLGPLFETAEAKEDFSFLIDDLLIAILNDRVI